MNKYAFSNVAAFGLGGAAAGGALGYFVGDKSDRKKRLRDILTYVLLGGMAGSGIGMYGDIRRNSGELAENRKSIKGNTKAIGDITKSVKDIGNAVTTNGNSISNLSDATIALTNNQKTISNILGKLVGTSRNVR